MGLVILLIAVTASLAGGAAMMKVGLDNVKEALKEIRSDFSNFRTDILATQSKMSSMESNMELIRQTGTEPLKALRTEINSLEDRVRELERNIP